MEALFENKHIRTRELSQEIYRYCFFGQIMLIFCYVVLLLCFVGNALLGNWGVCLLALGVIALQVIRYVRTVNLVTKRDAEACDQEMAVETVVTEDFVQQTASNGSVCKLEYRHVKKVAQTRNLILLFTQARLIYVFRKDGFTKGTPEEFLAFLKTKGFKV